MSIAPCLPSRVEERWRVRACARLTNTIANRHSRHPKAVRIWAVAKRTCSILSSSGRRRRARQSHAQSPPPIAAYHAGSVPALDGAGWRLHGCVGWPNAPDSGSRGATSGPCRRRRIQNTIADVGIPLTGSCSSGSADAVLRTNHHDLIGPSPSPAKPPCQPRRRKLYALGAPPGGGSRTVGDDDGLSRWACCCHTIVRNSTWPASRLAVARANPTASMVSAQRIACRPCLFDNWIAARGNVISNKKYSAGCA